MLPQEIVRERFLFFPEARVGDIFPDGSGFESIFSPFDFCDRFEELSAQLQGPMQEPAEREGPNLNGEFPFDAPPPYVLSMIRDTEVIIDDPFVTRVTVFQETRVQR